MRLPSIIAMGLLSITVAAPAAAQMSDSETAAVQRALDRGTLIYHYDQAAWHGTDDLREKDGELLPRVGGWVVDGPPDAPTLIFFDKDAADPHALYVAKFRDDKLVAGRVLGENDDRNLTPMRKRMIAALASARSAFRESDAEGCVQQPFNTVILPPATREAPVLVYFLTPQTTMKSIPMGGHYSFEVAADGKAGPMRHFTRSCMEMPFEGDKGKTQGLVVSHLLDSTPTEIHVFSMFAIRKPVYVVTTMNERVWAVENTEGQARIRLVKRDK